MLNQARIRQRGNSPKWRLFLAHLTSVYKLLYLPFHSLPFVAHTLTNQFSSFKSLSLFEIIFDNFKTQFLGKASLSVSFLTLVETRLVLCRAVRERFIFEKFMLGKWWNKAFNCTNVRRESASNCDSPSSSSAKQYTVSGGFDGPSVWPDDMSAVLFISRYSLSLHQMRCRYPSIAHTGPQCIMGALQVQH